MAVRANRSAAAWVAVLLLVAVVLAGCNKVNRPPGPPDTANRSLADATAALKQWCDRVQVVLAPGVLPVGVDPASITVRAQKATAGAEPFGGNASAAIGNGGPGCPARGTPVVTLRLETEVPDVVGASVSQARQALAAHGIGVTASGRTPLGDLGPVQNQQPAAGQRVELTAFGGPNGAVTLTPGVAVPELVGLRVSIACEVVKALGLQCILPPNFDPRQASFPVGGQEPAGKAVVVAGAPVAITVGTPTANLVEVPSVVGQSDTNACANLQSVGLGCGALSGTPPGAVARQVPVAGTGVAPGSPVYLFLRVSVAIVPDVVGRGEAEACAAILAAHLVCVAEPALNGTRPGEVLAQQPAGNTVADAGAQVTIQVANPPLILVPDVRTQQRDQACRALIDKQLACGVPPDPDQGAVSGQNPAAGTPVPPGTLVSLELPTGATVPPWLYAALGLLLLVLIGGGTLTVRRARQRQPGGSPDVSVRLATGEPRLRPDGLREW